MLYLSLDITRRALWEVTAGEENEEQEEEIQGSRRKGGSRAGVHCRVRIRYPKELPRACSEEGGRRGRRGRQDRQRWGT